MSDTAQAGINRILRSTEYPEFGPQPAEPLAGTRLLTSSPIYTVTRRLHQFLRCESRVLQATQRKAHERHHASLEKLGYERNAKNQLPLNHVYNAGHLLTMKLHVYAQNDV